MRLAGAGHPDPLVVRANGTVERFASSGPPCGTFASNGYSEHEFALASGDALVLYTDGVLDAGAPKRQLTIEQLSAALAPCAGQSADALADAVVKTVESCGGANPRDDHATLVLGAY